MADRIPLQLVGTPPAIEIDAARVAAGLGLAQAEFRQLMDRRQVTVLCERGTGVDAGRYRASFYYGGRRVRLVVDAQGHVLDGGGDCVRREALSPRA